MTPDPPLRTRGGRIVGWIIMAYAVFVAVVQHLRLRPSGGVMVVTILVTLILLAGLYFLLFLYRPNPMTRKKLRRFRSIRRGFVSFIILLLLFMISLVGELFVSNRAIAVSYNGELHFPTFADFKSGETFGFDYNYEVDYRELQNKIESDPDGGDWILMPLIPYDPLENDFREGLEHPAPPDFATTHYLGTDLTGRDILSRLFYGFRIAIVFALFFTLFVYFIGVVIGCAMGYFGGKVDLIGQRIVEIWANIPFLYMVIITVSFIPPGLGSFARIGILLGIMVIFSWTSMTYYMRTSTYKEKARDYVAAAQLLGGGTTRIIFRHVLPNTVAMLVTFLPFTVANAIIAITALDFLGFGLPKPTPSWGELLEIGTNNLYAHWIVLSAFFAMVTVLTLVTFIGEAVREAFDPKKFTVYK